VLPPAIALFLDCCQRVLRAEQGLIGQLAAAGFACDDGDWQFKLPALHCFICTQLPSMAAPTYRQFLQQLYASDLNQRLRELGAEIALLDNHGKVSRSLYGLRGLRGLPSASASARLPA
jgi:hypothetical protein